MRKLCALVAAAALALSVAAVAVALGASAPAPPGFVSCVGTAAGCASPSPGSLADVSALAVAPDGRHLYTAAFATNSVDAFLVGADGKLSFAGCIADPRGPAQGCAAVPEGLLDLPSSLVVGHGVAYVTALGTSTVVRLKLDGAGRPTFGGCIARDREGCSTRGAAALREPTGLALGPGDRDLYVTAQASGAILRLRTGAGKLRAAGCLAYAGAYGCGRTRKNSLADADAIAVAPDGRAAYAVAHLSDALTELGRSRSGALSYRGCIGDGVGTGCRPLPHGSLTGAAGIVVAPDGSAVYVAAQVGTVTRFDVTASGRLAFAGCIADNGLEGCARVPRRLLAGATGIAIAPDGRTLYVAAKGANAIVELSTAGGSAPRFLGCLRGGGGRGCGPVGYGLLKGAYAVALSPDGSSLFSGAASGSGAVSSFALGAPSR